MLGPALIRVIIYLWSRKNPEVPMTFMFGLRFKGAQLPWVMAGFNLLTGNLFMHSFYYLIHVELKFTREHIRRAL